MLLHKNKNLQNVLIGRQVFVGAAVVLLSRAGIVAPGTTEFFGLPEWFITGFMRSGVLGTLFCVVIGQLVSRSVATNYPKAYLNSRFMNTMVWLTLAVSTSGVFNAARVLGALFKRIARLNRIEHDVAGAGTGAAGTAGETAPAVQAKGRPAVLNW